MKTTIGLQRWGIPEMQEQASLIDMLKELALRPTTEANVTSINAVLDSLKELYKRFDTPGSRKKEVYEVVITIKVCDGVKAEYALGISARDEDEARSVALQYIFDELGTKITVKK